ncbi:hypothetical protein [Streptomyces sp. NPDC055749]
MLRHVIAPVRCYTKSAHDVLRHKRLNSDAKILLLHVQGLRDEDADKALSELARDVGITGAAFKAAKKLLVMHGFVHDIKECAQGGRWVTVQFYSNVPLTREDVARLRADASASPGVPDPAVGEPDGRAVGGQLPVDKERDKNTPHPPPEVEAEAEAEVEADASTEVVEGERVLLSLRHDRRELHLGVREARGLAGAAAEWLRQGVSAADLRRALVSGLPEGGVRSAVGFLRHRLVHKLPEAAAPRAEPRPPEPVPEFVVCAGPGDEHVFRSVRGETHCGPCGREEMRAVWAAWKQEAATLPEPPPWRERFAALREVPAPPA